MATPIKRIEKDFLLKVLYDEQVPIKYFYRRVEYTLVMEKPAKKDIFLRSNLPLKNVEPERKLNLIFDYRGRRITFSVEVSAVRDIHISASAPEFLYANLDRSFSRVLVPPDLKIQLGLLGDRYSLSYPKVYIYEEEEIGDAMRKMDPKDLSGLSAQLSHWIKQHTNGYKIVMFKDVKPSFMEEKVIAETGKILYLPAVSSGFLRTDPYPKKRLITEDLFRRCLESSGAETAGGEADLNHFLEEKAAAGILAEAWVPILFQEYVIGYLYVWINSQEKLPFTYAMLEVLSQFTKVLSFSLKVNSYFDNGKIKGEHFEGKIIDISVSGLLFAYTLSAPFSSLQTSSELAVKLMSPQRIIDASVKIARKYTDRTMGYFGCRFLDMIPEDTRFLFEYIYGVPLNTAEDSFLTGQV